jgi:hypothetical protein
MKTDTDLFVWMNRGFWLAWAAIGFIIWRTFSMGWGSPYMLYHDQTLAASVSTFSFYGRIVVVLEISIAIGFYSVLTFLMHRLINTVAKHQKALAKTLGTMKTIGFLLVGLSFYDFIISVPTHYILFTLGDLKYFEPSPFIDGLALAGGLTFLSLRVIIRRAILMQEDIDLTI